MATMGPLSMSSCMSANSTICFSRRQLTSNKALEERLLREVLVVVLEVLLGGRAHLHGNELEAVPISTMRLLTSVWGNTNPRFSKRERMGPTSPRWIGWSVHWAQWHKLKRNHHTWTPSGLIAMKLEGLSAWQSGGAEERGENLGIERKNRDLYGHTSARC